MRKAYFIAIAILIIGLTSCDNQEKYRNALDKGIELMMTYGKHAEAEEYFTEAIKYDKNSSEAYYYRGCAKFNRSKIKEAIFDFEKAIEIKPEYADADFALGRAYFILNDYDMSCYYYKLAEQNGRENMIDYLKACN
jgi:Tetratricopeptide repeat.